MAEEIILHHYDASLFSEKIRLAFGLKRGLALGDHSADHAAARSHAAHRRLS